MKRLRPLDTVFTSMESQRWPMHGAGVAILDPSTTNEPLTLERLKERVRRRLHLLPPFRERLVEPPFGIDAGYWVQDPHFDLDDHFHHVAVPAPGGLHELADIVAEFGGRPLDRARPLWEYWLVEGLEQGRLAVIEKVHHTMVDGLGSTELLGHLFDLEPDAAEPEPPSAPWKSERLPSQLELLIRSLPRIATVPLRTARTVADLAQAWRRSHAVRRGEASSAGRSFSAPRVSFNDVVERPPQKVFAMASVPLHEVHELGHSVGVSVNDVSLGLCGGALRRYLGVRGELPDESLVAMVPISLRSADDAEGGNRASAMFSLLHTHLADPVDRLQAIHEGVAATKRAHAASGRHMVDQLAALTPPGVWSGAFHLYETTRMAAHHPPAFNVAVTNMMALPVPLYLCGARVLQHYVMTMLFDGFGLVIAILSSVDSLDFGITAVRELTPDPWLIADGIHEELAELRVAVGASS